MEFKRILLASALLLALQAAGPDEIRIRSGAWQPPATRISVESRLVEIGVTVRDRNGAPIDGLEGSDFEVRDAGKPEPIKFFSARTSAPDSLPATTAASPSTTTPKTAVSRSIALYFDDVHTVEFGLNRAKVAAGKLIDTAILPDDRLAVFTPSGTVIQDFTTDRALVSSALARLHTHPRIEAKGIGVCPTLTPYQAYGIYHRLDTIAKDVAVAETVACNCVAGDAACAARQVGVVETAAQIAWNQVEIQSANAIDTLGVVLRHLSSAPGSRILLLMSPGFLTRGMDQRADALVDAALRARIVINSLDASGLESISPETLNDRNSARYNWAQRTMNTRQEVVTSLMALISPATGGQFLHNTNDFDTAVRRLATVTEPSYILGISPAGEPDGKYHALKIQLKKSEYKIEARPGYFATPPAPKLESAQDSIDHMVTAKDAVMAFPATVQVSAALRNDTQLSISVNTYVDAAALTFSEQDSRHKQQLTFVTVIEDLAGGYVTGKQAVMDFELKDATLADLRAKGIRTNTSFAVAKGSYVVRSVIREASAGKMAAIRTPVELH